MKSGKFFIILFFLFKSLVFAQEEEIIDKEVQTAKEAFEKGDFDKAIEHLENAYKIEPKPIFLFNIARCYEEKKDYEKAIEKFKQYLSLIGDVQEKEDAMKRIFECEKKISKLPYGFIVIRKFIDSSALKIDGEEFDYKEGEKIKVLIGEHFLEIENKDYELIKIGINIISGKTTELVPVYIPVEKQKVIEVKKVPVEEKKIKKEEEFPYKTIGFICAGGALALLGTGVTFSILSKNDRDKMNSAENMIKAKEYEDRANKKSTISLIFYGVGGATAIAGGIMFYLNHKQKKKMKISYDGNKLFFGMHF